MLGMDFIRANGDTVAWAMKVKGVSGSLETIMATDAEIRRIKTLSESLRALKNDLSNLVKAPNAAPSPEAIALLATGEKPSRETWISKSREISDRIKDAESSLVDEQATLNRFLLALPGIPWSGAPVGPDESFNTVIRTEGSVPSFDFTPLDHVALIEANDWGDLSRIVKVSGSRTYCLKGRLALLETKLMGWALEQIAAAGFTPITVPAIAREQAFLNQGQFPGHTDETYALPNDDAWLAGTAEVALTSLHSGEIVDGSKLPILYAGYSPCFRREAGSAGKDVRGLLRVHQFLKVEQWVMCPADEAVSAEWHAKLLGLAEQLLTLMEIPNQVVETSTGDMGLGKFRMNDIESWVPSLGKYRETHSCSTLHEWQARRANLRYRDGEGKVRFAHTLNNTALASPRILVPLLENHQTADGRVRLPSALRELMGRDEYL